MSSKAPYRGNARFIEIGAEGAPFRSVINVDHITNLRFEQQIGEDDNGTPVLEGWIIVLLLGHGAGSQNIFFPEEAQAVHTYNSILDMINGTGAPIQRMPKLKPQPVASPILGANGEAANVEAPGDDIPPLTEEELEQLANPEIDINAIADAVEDGLGADENK